MSRPARALVDLGALRHNYLQLREKHGGRALAVVKANAYGHGSVPCAHALQDVADGFAVAFSEEALTLRNSGIVKPILVLEGAFDTGDLDLACHHDLWLVVHCAEQVRMVESHPVAPGRLHLWLKVDCGMHRAGIAPGEATLLHRRLAESGKAAEIVVMSHFSRADEPDTSVTIEQVCLFDAATASIPGERSLCNSAGVLAWPLARRDWARPGIALYGADPLPSGEHGLSPVMTLESAVMAIRTLERGEPLGYGGRFVAKQKTRVGLVAVGYADGYPRSIAPGTRVAVEGGFAEVLGRVSMDMLSIDLTQLPNVGLGSRVELWGRQISVNEIASAAGTIAYELLCNVKRVPFHYLEDSPEPALADRRRVAKADFSSDHRGETLLAT